MYQKVYETLLRIYENPGFERSKLNDDHCHDLIHKEFARYTTRNGVEKMYTTEKGDKFVEDKAKTP